MRAVTSGGPDAGRLGPADLAEAEAALRQACGITFSAALRRSTAARVSAAARRVGVDDREFVARLRRRDTDALEALVDCAVVCETYFFRHPEQLAALRRALIDPAPCDRPLSFWSAGCASGEEPYSLAMMLLDAGRASARDRVVATDVSREALASARAGAYGDWSMRGVPRSVRSRHFSMTEGRAVVGELARARVEFRRHNLVHEEPPGSGFDAVLCRNILIYFDRETAARVLRRLVAATRPGGYLVLAPVEMSLASSLMLEWIDGDGGGLLRRPSAGDPAPPPSRRRSAPAPRARGRTPREDRAVPARARHEPPEPRPPSAFEEAREAARRGDLGEAERLARQVAGDELLPEAYLLLAHALDARGDLAGAIEALRRALYIDPAFAVGHAALAALFQRLGDPAESERARRNALSALRGVDNAKVLRGVEAVTAGALRQALEQGALRRGSSKAG